MPVRRSNPYLKYDFTLELIGDGNLAIGQRRWDDAIAAFSAACERYDVADHGGFAAYPWARLAMAYAYAGRTEDATRALDRARATPKRAMRITGEQVAVTIAWTEAVLGNPAGPGTPTTSSTAGRPAVGGRTSCTPRRCTTRWT